VRNAKKRNGRQNLRCKDCRKQFQEDYVYKGCVPENKSFALKMLCRGSGIRDAAAVTGVSSSTELALLKEAAAGITLKPQKHQYRQVQIDEQWSYVGKKEKKV
jgi:transposase-like protein